MGQLERVNGYSVYVFDFLPRSGGAFPILAAAFMSSESRSYLVRLSRFQSGLSAPIT